MDAEKIIGRTLENLKKSMFCLMTCKYRGTCKYMKIKTQDEETLDIIGRNRRICAEKRYRWYIFREKTKNIIRKTLPIILIVAAGVMYQVTISKIMDIKIERAVQEINMHQALTDEEIFNIQTQMELIIPEE